MTARTGMADLITELRGMAEAGTADYTLGSSTYWTDDHLQNILDQHRQDLVFAPLTSYPTMGTAGTLVYQDYRSGYEYFETTSGGTAIFYLQDSTGAMVGTTSYTPDYRRGQVTFGTTTAGTSYYLTGRSYDLNAAAAEVWCKKAAHYAATAFDFSTDNHSVSRSQVYDHCLRMATFFEGNSGNSVQTVQMCRGHLA